MTNNHRPTDGMFEGLMSKIGTDRAGFRQHALSSRQAVHKGDSVAANKEIAAAEKIAAH